MRADGTSEERAVAADAERHIAQLNARVAQLHAEGRYADAIPLAAESVDLARQTLGE